VWDGTGVIGEHGDASFSLLDPLEDRKEASRGNNSVLDVSEDAKRELRSDFCDVEKYGSDSGHPSGGLSSTASAC